MRPSFYHRLSLDASPNCRARSLWLGRYGQFYPAIVPRLSRLLLHDNKTGPKTVWLGDEARVLLSSFERRGAADPVFEDKVTKRPLHDIGAFWLGVKAEAGLPGVRLHDLRHSFASHAAARSETLPMIGKLLGHAKIATTSRYAHLDDGHVLQAAQRIGNLIADAMGETLGSNHETTCGQ